LKENENRLREDEQIDNNIKCFEEDEKIKNYDRTHNCSKLYLFACVFFFLFFFIFAFMLSFFFFFLFFFRFVDRTSLLKSVVDILSSFGIHKGKGRLPVMAKYTNEGDEGTDSGGIKRVCNIEISVGIFIR
jgi:hypothetical protein